MQAKNFSIKKALSFGLKKTNEHIALMLSIELIFFCAWFLFVLAGATAEGIPEKVVDPNFLQKGILLLGAYLHNLIPLSIKSHIIFSIHIFAWLLFLATLVLLQGARRIMLDIYEKNESHLSQLYSQCDVFSVIILATLFYALIVILGTICIILPGIYLSAKHGLYAYALLDDKTLGPIEALKKSSQITKGFVNHLCLYSIIWIILLYLSIISFVLWIVVVPVLMLAEAYIYRQITQETAVHKETIYKNIY